MAKKASADPVLDPDLADLFHGGQKPNPFGRTPGNYAVVFCTAFPSRDLCRSLIFRRPDLPRLLPGLFCRARHRRLRLLEASDR